MFCWYAGLIVRWGVTSVPLRRRLGLGVLRGGVMLTFSSSDVVNGDCRMWGIWILDLVEIRREPV